MSLSWRRPSFLVRLALLGFLGALFSAGLLKATQPLGPSEREIKSKPGELDKEHVWTLDFRFKDPRIIKVHVPGRGTRLCWYLWYQVINRTGKPRTFIPDFELVTQDFYGTWHDEVLPSVQEEIKRIEDPTGYYDIKNSVTITEDPIPPSKKEDAFPRAVTGVAVWDGSPANPGLKKSDAKDLSRTTRFKIFVSGLSNGWILVEPLGSGPGAEPIVRRKTLQLGFKKIGDEFQLESREIQFTPPAEWVYRKADLLIPKIDLKP